MSNDPSDTEHAGQRALSDRALVTAFVDIDVPFQDLDPVQIVWHGNYFRYFEAARAALLRKIDYDYPQMETSNYAWPLTDARVRFIQPVRYAQKIRAWAGLVEWENWMKVEYVIRDIATDARLTTGYTVQCAVRIDTWELQWVSPSAFLERLEEYL